MSLHFSVTKAERSKLRSLPFLPRFAVTVEVGGRQLTYRHTPALETLNNLRNRGFSLSALKALAAEELAEIRLPALKPAIKKGLAQVKTIKDKVASARPVRKAPVKAALRKKPDSPAAAPEALGVV